MVFNQADGDASRIAGEAGGKTMAAHLENADIKALPVAQYATIRPQLRSGDLLFASGDYLVSKAIREVTGSPWSHVGIVLRFDAVDRVLLLESVEDMGVRFAPLSKYLADYEDGKPYRGRLLLARCANLAPAAAAAICAFGMDELTQPYDRDEVAKIVARIALGIGRKTRDREYICSELVYECYASAGKQIAYNAKGFISPEDIWRDADVGALARVL